MTSANLKKIRIQLEKILDTEGIEHEIQGKRGSYRYIFPAGSTKIWLGLSEKEEYCVLMFYSPLLGDISEKDAGFAMVKLNHQLPFGTLVYQDDDKELGLSYMVAIDDLGTKELLIPLEMLQRNADLIDDLLLEVIGGIKTGDRIQF